MPGLLESLNHLAPYLTVGAKVAAALALAGLAYFFMRLIQAVPLSVVVSQADDKRIDYAPLLKGIACLVVFAVSLIHIVGIAFLTLIMSTKIALVEMLLVGIIICWVGITNSSNWARQLLAIQAECELATNLTFLQGEMVRAQLEDINTRLHRQLEPEEVDAAQTLMQVISPVMMLFVQKEKSIMKWSMAALNVSKTLSKFFNSPKNSAQ